MNVLLSRPVLSSFLPLLLISISPMIAARHAHARSADSPAPAVASSLPDSPGALVAAANSFSSSLEEPVASSVDMSGFGGQATVASTKSTPLPRVKFISAGQTAPRQTAHDKVLLGLRESVTPFSMMAWGASAGWSHLINSSPNYGVNSEAFAQRLGAAAATGASKEIFSDSILAPIFHQDPRYYQLGRGHKFINRAVYAATRSVIGRTDGGKSTVNYAAILGTGGSATLNLAYYPDRNHNAPTVMRNWASGIGGSALGYVISEFGGEVIQALHLKKDE